MGFIGKGRYVNLEWTEWTVSTELLGTNPKKTLQNLPTATMDHVVESEHFCHHTWQKFNFRRTIIMYFFSFHILYFLQNKFITYDWQIDVANAMPVLCRYACLATFMSYVKPQLQGHLENVVLVHSL